MNDQNTVFQTLNVVIIITAFVLGSLLYYISKFRPASKYLSIFFFTILASMLNLDTIQPHKHWQAVFFIIDATSKFLFPQSLFLYVKNLFSPKPFLHKSNIKHYYFSILYCLVLCTIFAHSFVSDKNVAYKVFENTNSFYFKAPHFLTSFIFPMLCLFYISHIYIYIKKYNQKIKNIFSTIDKIQLQHIRYILFSFTLSLLIFIGIELFSEYFNKTKEFIVSGILLHAFFIIGYFGLRQQQPFANELQEKNDSKREKTNSEKHPSTHFLSLTQKDRDTIKTGIKKAMEQEKLYRNPQLQLQDIANKVQVSKHFIVHILEEDFNSNFFQYVNYHRINEACGLLKNKQYSIETIAKTVGFCNKTTFNKSFKNMKQAMPEIIIEAHTSND